MATCARCGLEDASEVYSCPRCGGEFCDECARMSELEFGICHDCNEPERQADADYSEHCQ